MVMLRADKGFITIFMLVIILVMSLLSGFFILIAENERRTAQNFFAGLQAQSRAEAGIQEVFAKLNTEKNFGEMARMASSSGSLVLQSHNFTDGEGFQVYISSNNNECIIFSIGKYDNAKRQVVAYLDFSADDQIFSIVRVDSQ